MTRVGRSSAGVGHHGLVEERRADLDLAGLEEGADDGQVIPPRRVREDLVGAVAADHAPEAIGPQPPRQQVLGNGVEVVEGHFRVAHAVRQGVDKIAFAHLDQDRQAPQFVGDAHDLVALAVAW